MKREHAITPTDAGPKRNGDWRFDAAAARRSNPDFEYTPPQVSKCGRFVQLDACGAFGLLDPADKVRK